MSNILKDKLIERIQQLLNDSKLLTDTARNYVAGDTTLWFVDVDLFHKWKVSSENLIEKASGKESSYYKNFVNNVDEIYSDHVAVGVGILTGLKNDLEQGFIDDPIDVARAEVFTDFLDMAEHLLAREYRQPSASLIGAVLEDGLRKISKKHDISTKSSKGIGSLNTKLANGKVYNRLKQKEIEVWKDIRDKADHGHFEEFDIKQVQDMLSGVRRFLADYL